MQQKSPSGIGGGGWKAPTQLAAVQEMGFEGGDEFKE